MCRVRSRLQYIVVEYVDNDKPIIYVGDGGTRSIIVWNVQANEGYRVKLPRSSSTTCADSAAEDVFYLALIESANNFNYVYFTYLSSADMFKVRTKDLRKRVRPGRGAIVNVGRKPRKMVVLGSAYGSLMYFRVKGQNHLYSWDTKEGFLEENVMLVKYNVHVRAFSRIRITVIIIVQRSARVKNGKRDVQVKKSVDCRTITHVDVDNDGVLWELESNIEDFVTDAVGCYGASVILAPVFGRPVPLRADRK